MRITFFNIWHGKIWNGLQRFISEESSKTDIFCFLEVDSKLQVKLTRLLPGFEPFYEEIMKTDYLDGEMDGQSIFVKNGIKTTCEGKEFIYRVTKDDAGILQYIEINVNGINIFIGGVHGKALPGTKIDTPARLKQSQKIIDFFAKKKGLKIIGGDFNLNPDTKSVKMFEEAGYKNLIRDFDIKNTRNELSWKQFNNVQHFADFCFVSPEVKVKSFEVPYNEISDHLPLILDFEI